MPLRLSTAIVCLPAELLSESEFYASLYGLAVETWETSAGTPWDRCPLLPAYNPTDILVQVDLHRLYIVVLRHGGYKCVEKNNRWSLVALESQGEGAAGRLRYVNSRTVRDAYLTYLVCYENFSRKAKHAYWRTDSSKQLAMWMREMPPRVHRKIKSLRVMINKAQAAASAALVLQDARLPVDWFKTWDIDSIRCRSESDQGARSAAFSIPDSDADHSEIEDALGVRPFDPKDTNFPDYDPPLGSTALLRFHRWNILRRENRQLGASPKITPQPSYSDIAGKMYDEVRYTLDGSLCADGPTEPDQYPTTQEALNRENTLTEAMVTSQQAQLVGKYGFRPFDEREPPAPDPDAPKDPFHFGKWLDCYGIEDGRLHELWRTKLSEGGFDLGDIEKYDPCLAGEGDDTDRRHNTDIESGSGNSSEQNERDEKDDDISVTYFDGHRKSAPPEAIGSNRQRASPSPIRASPPNPFSGHVFPRPNCNPSGIRIPLFATKQQNAERQERLRQLEHHDALTSAFIPENHTIRKVVASQAQEMHFYQEKKGDSSAQAASHHRPDGAFGFGVDNLDSMMNKLLAKKYGAINTKASSSTRRGLLQGRTNQGPVHGLTSHDECESPDSPNFRTYDAESSSERLPQ